MSDLLILILLVATVNTLLSLMFSYLRVYFIKFKLRNQETITLQSSVNYYNDEKKGQIKRNFVFHSIVFALLSALVSNSILDFVFAMGVIVCQFYLLYRFYIKQKPVFYVFQKGIACVLLVPSLEKESVGVKKWQEVTYCDEWGQKVFLAGKDFQFEMFLEQHAKDFLKPALKLKNYT